MQLGMSIQQEPMGMCACVCVYNVYIYICVYILCIKYTYLYNYIYNMYIRPQKGRKVDDDFPYFLVSNVSIFLGLL